MIACYSKRFLPRSILPPARSLTLAPSFLRCLQAYTNDDDVYAHCSADFYQWLYRTNISHVYFSSDVSTRTRTVMNTALSELLPSVLPLPVSSECFHYAATHTGIGGHPNRPSNGTLWMCLRGEEGCEGGRRGMHVSCH